MNWGNKIVIGFVVFAGFVFTLVYKMVTSGNDLVSKEYYHSGEEVNAELKLRDASASIRQGFSIGVSEDDQNSIRLKFKTGESKPEGEITLTCLSSDKADQKEGLALLKTDSLWSQTIELKQFQPGNWLCEIRGKMDGNAFVVKDEFRIYKPSQP